MLLQPALSRQHLPHILLVHGHEVPNHDLRLAIGRRFELRECRLETLLQQDIDQNHPIIFDVPLDTPAQIEALRLAIRMLPRPVPPVCCVISRLDRALMLRAHALGAEAVLHRPLGLTSVQHTLERMMDRSRRAKWKTMEGPEGIGLSAGTDVLEDLFSFAQGGTRMTQYELYDRGDSVIESLSETGLGTWVEAVREHHSQTFRHSLLVTGIAVGFGQMLTMRQEDLRRLAIAGLLHDVGKAFIPAEILEKPGRLEGDEQVVMRQHVNHGRNILTQQGGFSPEMIDVVAHHHEMLDGSGYPNGLMGNNIKDLVRVLTISDIFAALIEERAYKTAMDNETAYSILESMKGKLDPDLLNAFRPIARETKLAA